MANVAWNLPAGMEAGLEATSFYDPPNFIYPFGAHVAVVEVDVETGQVELKRYVAVDDCGPQINPMIVEGQVHGGVVQGIGQALWEGAVYDDNGQLVTGSLLDYALPRADACRTSKCCRQSRRRPITRSASKASAKRERLRRRPPCTTR